MKAEGDSGAAKAGRALQAEPKPQVAARIELARRATETWAKTPPRTPVLAKRGGAAANRAPAQSIVEAIRDARLRSPVGAALTSALFIEGVASWDPAPGRMFPDPRDPGN